MAFQDFYDEVQKLYIAYYQRPADPGGLRYWAQRLEAAGGSLEGIIDAFATSPEAVSLYDFDADGAIDLDDASDMIDAIYQALFNRSPDDAGKQFYLDALTNGQFPDGRIATPGRVALDILNGAQNDDAVAIANKLQMATLFTHILDPNDDGIPPYSATYHGPSDEAAGRAFLAQFTADPTTLKTQGQVIQDIRTTIADPGDPILSGQTLTLTTGVDNINVTDPGSFDIVTGIVDGDGDGDTANSTFTPGDVIDGNGLTELRLTVVESGDAAFATVKDVSEVNLIAGDDVSVDFNAVDWSNVGSIHYAGGVDGMAAFIDNLSANRVDLVIDFTTTGSLSASYTDDLWVGMFLGFWGDEGGKASFIDENFAATVADSGSVTISVTSSHDVSLGDLAATVGDDASFGYSVDVSGTSTDLSLGDIAVDAGDSAWAWIFIQNTDAAGDLAVGDLSLNLGVSTSFTVTISATNNVTGHALGDFSVGDIDLVLADEAWSPGPLYLYHVQNEAAAGAGIGAFTVGDMSVQMGADTTLTVSLSQLLYGTGTGTMGDVTVGALDVSMGIGADFSYSLEVENTITSDIGSVTLGEVNLTADDGASVSYTVEISQDGIGDIRQVTVGDVSVVLGVSASVESWSYDIFAASGDIGSVSVGDLSVEVGVNSDFDDYSLSVWADSGTIDTVAVGDLTAVIASGGSFSYSVSISGDLGVGTVSFGDIDVSADAADSVSLDYWISASSGDVGTVTFGDVALAAQGTMWIEFEVDVLASGDAGQLSLGDVSLETTVSSTIDFSLDSDGALDGDISLGEVALDFNSGTSTDLNLNIGHATYTGDITIAALRVFQTVTDDALIVDLADITVDFLANTLSQQLTIGTVDFSGLVKDDSGSSLGVSIDVSGILGNVQVIGSGYDDTITDNAKTNKLTGGGGDDLFSFVIGNTGNTLATADEITDFSHADDTIEFDVTTTADFDATTYFEGTFASFAAFIAGANAAMSSALEDNLVAGQVGSDTFLAIDTDDGDQIDFVVKLTGVSIAQLDFSDFTFV